MVTSVDIVLAWCPGFQERAVYPPRVFGVGRDRSAARTTVGGELPALARSIGEVGASCHRGPRFRRPPTLPDGGLSPGRCCPGLPSRRLPIPCEASALPPIPPGALWLASQGAPWFPSPPR